MQRSLERTEEDQELLTFQRELYPDNAHPTVARVFRNYVRIRQQLRASLVLTRTEIKEILEEQ